MVLHAMSDFESYTEKQLKVQRPRLTVTRLDPNFYFSEDYKGNAHLDREASSPASSVDAEDNFESNV